VVKVYTSQQQPLNKEMYDDDNFTERDVIEQDVSFIANAEQKEVVKEVVKPDIFSNPLQNKRK
jgi:hypothetical protein